MAPKFSFKLLAVFSGAQLIQPKRMDRAFDMQSYGKLRYNLLGNGGH